MTTIIIDRPLLARQLSVVDVLACNRGLPQSQLEALDGVSEFLSELVACPMDHVTIEFIDDDEFQAGIEREASKIRATLGKKETPGITIDKPRGFTLWTGEAALGFESITRDNISYAAREVYPWVSKCWQMVNGREIESFA